MSYRYQTGNSYSAIPVFISIVRTLTPVQTLLRVSTRITRLPFTHVRLSPFELAAFQGTVVQCQVLEQPHPPRHNPLIPMKRAKATDVSSVSDLYWRTLMLMASLDPRYSASTTSYIVLGSQGQLRSPSLQDPPYHSPVEQHIRPPDYPPPLVTESRQNQPHSQIPQQPLAPAPYNVPYPIQTQPQIEGPGHISRDPQRQQVPTYYQQQQNPVPRYQQSSVPQYHDPQNLPPSSEYRRNPEPSRSGYPMMHALPSENTTTPDVRYMKRDNSTSYDQRESVCMATIFQQFDSSTPQAGPTCRLLGCNRPVTMDVNTSELSEYCTKEHMQFVAVSLVLVVL